MNDEQRVLIAAYKDGELDTTQASSAQQLIARDAEAKRYWEDLLEIDRLLHSTFDPVAEQPIPEKLLAVIQPAAKRHYSHLLVPLALAASLVLVAVLVVRQSALDQQMQDQLVLMQQQIAQLRNETLENIPSGSAASWVAPVGQTRAQVIPLKTYRAKNNQFCREYEERIEDAQGVEVRRGIACRAGKSDWPDMANKPLPTSPDVRL